MTERESSTLRALRVACRLSPDGWVEAWEIEPFLPIEMYVSTDSPWYSDARDGGPFRSGGMPRRFAGAFTAWRWRKGQQVTATLTWLARKGLAESCPLLKMTRTGNLAYVGKRAWRATP